MQFCPMNFIVYFGSTFIVLLNVTSVHRTILLWVYIIFMLLVFSFLQLKCKKLLVNFKPVHVNLSFASSIFCDIVQIHKNLFSDSFFHCLFYLSVLSSAQTHSPHVPVSCYHYSEMHTKCYLLVSQLVTVTTQPLLACLQGKYLMLYMRMFK